MAKDSQTPNGDPDMKASLSHLSAGPPEATEQRVSRIMSSVHRKIGVRDLAHFTINGLWWSLGGILKSVLGLLGPEKR